MGDAYETMEALSLPRPEKELADLRAQLAAERERAGKAERELEAQHYVADSLNTIAVDNADALSRAWDLRLIAEAERDRLKEALQWYADECSMPDRARTALAAVEAGEEERTTATDAKGEEA